MAIQFGKVGLLYTYFCGFIPKTYIETEQGFKYFEFHLSDILGLQN